MRLADGYELAEAVPLADLRPHPKNPNQGDVGAIAESIETVGFYGVVVAQKPNGSRKTGRILAGEHRWRAAKADGAEAIPVCWVDVDDDEAERIMVGDNRIARLAAIDREAQVTVLEAMALSDRGLAGTGFDGDDLDHFIAMLEKAEEGEGQNGVTDSLADRKSRYEGQEARNVVLLYQREDFQQAMALFAKARDELDLESNADVVLALLRDRFA